MKKTRRPLTEEEIKAFREQLLQEKEKLWEQIRKDLLNKVGEEYQDFIKTVKEVEDLSQADLDEETWLGIVEARKEELEAIAHALWKIDYGDYGKCERCRKWICIERLQIRPQSVYCLECKKELEQLKHL